MKPVYALLASILLLAACGGKPGGGPVASAEQVKAALVGVDPAAQQALYELYTAAREAGEPGATIYVASVAEELKPLADEFARTFPGLKADYQRYIGVNLTARLDGEYGSGRHTGDVVLPSFLETANLAAIGRLQPYEPPTLGQLPASLRDPNGYYYAPYKKPFTLIYNTRLVAPDEIPQTIGDVLQPKWRGRYVAPGSGAAGPSDTALSLLKTAGKLTDQQIIDFAKHGDIGPPSSELLPSVSQGRYAFALWSSAAAAIAQRDEGAPLDVAFSPNLSVQTNVGVGVLSKAPRPNSAKLFTAWLFTPRAQQILTELYFYGAQPDAPTPKGFPPLASHINGAIDEDAAYFDRIKAFREYRVALAAQNR